MERLGSPLWPGIVFHLRILLFVNFSFAAEDTSECTFGSELVRLCGGGVAERKTEDGAMEALQAKRAAVKGALAEMRREKKALERKVRSAERVWHLTPFLKDAILIMVVLAGYSAEPAAKYLATVARKRRWPARSDEDLRREAEDVFLTWDDMEKLADLTSLESPSNPVAMKVALRNVEEWRLAQWVARLNEQQGVAPCTDQVLERYEQARARLPEELRPLYRGTAVEARARVWALGWRRRWGGRHGHVRVREDVPLEERREKAAQDVTERALTYSEPTYGKRFWGGNDILPNVFHLARNGENLRSGTETAVARNPETGTQNFQFWRPESGPNIGPGNRDVGTQNFQIFNLSVPNPGRKLVPESGLKIGPGKRATKRNIIVAHFPG